MFLNSKDFNFDINLYLYCFYIKGKYIRFKMFGLNFLLNFKEKRFRKRLLIFFWVGGKEYFVERLMKDIYYVGNL